jgi:hypothetical protein
VTASVHFTRCHCGACVPGRRFGGPDRKVSGRAPTAAGGAAEGRTAAKSPAARDPRKHAADPLPRRLMRETGCRLFRWVCKGSGPLGSVLTKLLLPRFHPSAAALWACALCCSANSACPTLCSCAVQNSTTSATHENVIVSLRRSELRGGGGCRAPKTRCCVMRPVGGRAAPSGPISGARAGSPATTNVYL